MPDLKSLVLNTTSLPSPPPSPPTVILEGFWRYRQDPPTHLAATDPSVYLPWPMPDDSISTEERTSFLATLVTLESMLKTLTVEGASLDSEEQFQGGSDPDVERKGYSHCRLCRKLNGRDEFWVRRGGVEVRWPEGLRHCVERHGIWVGEELAGLVRWFEEREK